MVNPDGCCADPAASTMPSKSIALIPDTAAIHAVRLVYVTRLARAGNGGAQIRTAKVRADAGNRDMGQFSHALRPARGLGVCAAAVPWRITTKRPVRRRRDSAPAKVRIP